MQNVWAVMTLHSFLVISRFDPYSLQSSRNLFGRPVDLDGIVCRPVWMQSFLGETARSPRNDVAWVLRVFRHEVPFSSLRGNRPSTMDTGFRSMVSRYDLATLVCNNIMLRGSFSQEYGETAPERFDILLVSRKMLDDLTRNPTLASRIADQWPRSLAL